jgi:hypothetical protein
MLPIKPSWFWSKREGVQEGRRRESEAGIMDGEAQIVSRYGRFDSKSRAATATATSVEAIADGSVARLAETRDSR